MNIYKPATMRLLDAREEAPEVRTFRLQFLDGAVRSDFFERYRVGQFGLYGVPGAGECTFCVASPPTRPEYIECTFRRNGRVTQALQDREVGQMITFRGPYGNCFPTDSWRGKNLLFAAGGIALPPVRSVIWNVLDRRSEFGEITIVYGARTVADLVYKHELEQWAARPDVDLVLTVDPGGETPEWKGKIGFVPDLMKALPPARNAVAVVCGPPIMIKLSLPVLMGLGFSPAEIFTTLENRMKCGVGKCGRCNVGPMYVCKDGPVFTAEQLKRLPQGDL
jgi:NAD(P)H-flavin reductase